MPRHLSDRLAHELHFWPIRLQAVNSWPIHFQFCNFRHKPFAARVGPFQPRQHPFQRGLERRRRRKWKRERKAAEGRQHFDDNDPVSCNVDTDADDSDRTGLGSKVRLQLVDQEAAAASKTLAAVRSGFAEEVCRTTTCAFGRHEVDPNCDVIDADVETVSWGFISGGSKQAPAGRNENTKCPKIVSAAFATKNARRAFEGSEHEGPVDQPEAVGRVDRGEEKDKDGDTDGSFKQSVKVMSINHHHRWCLVLELQQGITKELLFPTS